MKVVILHKEKCLTHYYLALIHSPHFTETIVNVGIKRVAK